MERDERYIIQRVLDGDTHLFEHFLNHYAQQVFHLVLSIVEERNDAEELTQDIFLKAYESLSSFKAGSSFSTWIYRIAYNTAISAVRRRKQTPMVVDDALIANLAATQVDELLDDTREEQIQHLHQAISQLDASERALLTLYYDEERPISEVAHITGLTEVNVKVRLHRIRKKLYILLTQHKP